MQLRFGSISWEQTIRTKRNVKCWHLLSWSFFFGTAIGVFIARPRYKGIEGVDSNKNYPLWWLGFLPLILGLIIFTFSCFTTVGARTVGVETTFGKVDGVIGSGLHTKAPWEQVHAFSSTIQTVRLTDAQNVTDVEGGPVVVRLGNQTTARVNVTVQWQINTGDHKAVENLYAKYRGFDHIGPNLFVPQLQHALLPPFENFNPLAQLQTDLTGQGLVEVPTSQLEQKARAELEKNIGDSIRVTSFAINLVQYDQTTQDKLNNYAQAIGDTRIAEQQERTSAAQAKANTELAASQATSNAGVLYQNCLSLTERLATAGKPLPPAWTCGNSNAQPVLTVNK